MTRKLSIHPERTAILRHAPSAPTREAEPLLSGKILDYGAGHGQDTVYLKNLGFDTKAYDPYYFPKHPAKREKFDWVLLNYVLNVIPSLKEREAVLDDIGQILNPGGHLLVSVRTQEEVEGDRKKEWSKHNDGWVTEHETFQHGYTREELELQLSQKGFKVERFLNSGTAVAVKSEELHDNLSSAVRHIPFGKKMPQAVYIHKTLKKLLPPEVREAVEKSESFLPRHAKWNIIKMATNAKSMSFLWYPDFDTDPHPALRYGYNVELNSNKVKTIDHRRARNPFILHRKETFVGKNYPLYPQFCQETRREEKAGLLSRSDIGTLEGWEKAKKAVNY